MAQSLRPSMLRYGGTFSKCLRWKRFRGPAHLRQPYSDGIQSHQGSTRAFGFFEVQSLCEAINVTCILGFAIHCSTGGEAHNLADFVEYALAPAPKQGAAGGSQWGRQRALDGHPEPYKITHLQLGNEQFVSELVGTFAAGAEAMEARAKAFGHGGKLTYVLGSDMRSDSGGSIVDDGNTSVVLREIKAAGLCEQTIWDWHIQPSTYGYDRTNATKDLFHLKAFKALLDSTGCPCRVAVLEENLCQAHFTRALADAFASNALQRQPLMAMQATSQMWSHAGNFNDGCGEGHIYTLPNQTWLSPPGWASQMLFTSFQPNVLAVDINSDKAAVAERQCGTAGAAVGCVDVFAALSEAGDALTIRLVNSMNVSHALRLRIVRADGTPVAVEPEAELLSLASPLSANQTAFAEAQGGVNPVNDPLLISAKRTNTTFSAAEPWVVPRQSFQALLLRVASAANTPSSSQGR